MASGRPAFVCWGKLPLLSFFVFLAGLQMAQPSTESLGFHGTSASVGTGYGEKDLGDERGMRTAPVPAGTEARASLVAIPASTCQPCGHPGLQQSEGHRQAALSPPRRNSISFTVINYLAVASGAALPWDRMGHRHSPRPDSHLGRKPAWDQL